ncbi:tyrosine-type recombinase/integrase [Xanthobacter versatilis]|uniref:tyrosine-type recombinase/integrase n=1 Tax=Xanthobacter autotrophicus (strain ATCC BAA-1158 / Py2) TaxID=78245 RepID=UPI00372CA036
MLTDTAVKAAKPKERPYKLSDAEGLHLLVTPQGGKLWRLAYRFDGKQRQLSFGSYKYVTLAEARERRTEAKRLLASGVDPGANIKSRKAEQRAAEEAAQNTFGVVASEFIEKIRKEGRAPATMEKAEWLLRTIAAPLANRPISEITAREVLDVLRPVEAKGNHEAARRARSTIGRVLRYAIATDRAERDVTSDLKGALIAPPVQHRAAITEEKGLRKLMAAIYAWERGQPTTIAALKLLAILALRPGEVRAARWVEIDLEKAVWTIPAGRTKMRRQHRTPLPRQAVEVLKTLQPVTDRGPDSLVFHATTSVLKPISENTLNVAIRRLGFTASEMTSHGFRAAFATLANESRKWHPDAIERQLAHVEGNNVRRAYTRGEHWEERISLMQWWADHLDWLREDAAAKAPND